MKYIKRKSAVKPITGSIVDTTNIDDKTKNTYSARVIDEMNTYSTEEQVIGTWINGKPLYRKVVVANNPTVNNVVPFNTPDISQIIRVSGMVGCNNGERFLLPTGYAENDTFNARYAIGIYRLTQEGAFIYAGTYFTNTTTIAGITFILEYTKTTD